MSPEQMAFLAEAARTRSGLLLAPDRTYLAESRLGPLARKHGAASVEAFVDALRRRPDAALLDAVAEALTTNETSFFRDKAAFAQLREQVLPQLAAARPPGAPLRLWSAACSTGQEPYSLAMLLDELRQPADLCASDLSERVLEKARAGLYTQFEVQRGLPIRSLVKHFDKVDEAWRVKPRLRQAVRWRRFNLLDDMAPLGRFDLIACRNVVMYFDAESKRRVLEALAGALAPDGVLILGAAEAVMDVTDALQPAPGRDGVYVRSGARPAAAPGPAAAAR